MPQELPGVNVRVREITERIRERSRKGRAEYLARMDSARRRGSARAGLSCTNLAHGFAASDATDKEALKLMRWPNVAIVSAYNDMLSAHQPLERYPALIKRAAQWRNSRAACPPCATA
jgi:phosphogluconate dehydratase